MTENRIRLLAELVSLDAWTTPVVTADNAVSLHVELSFQNGYFGGDDPDLDFTFTAKLSRAILTIYIEKPMKIDRSSISRENPEREIEISKYKNVRRSIISTNSGNISINPARFAAKLASDFLRSNTLDHAEEAKMIEKVPLILVSPQPGGANEYRWELEPSYEAYLSGQPWHPTAEPRLNVECSAGDRSDRAIKVTLACKRSDLHILDLRKKDETLPDKMSYMIGRKVNEVAAIQYIKKKLCDAILSPGAIDNRFSYILLGDILADFS